MQAIGRLYLYFKLCLLVAICTADSENEELMKSDNVNKLDANAVADDVEDDADAVQDKDPDETDKIDDHVEDDVQVQDDNVEDGVQAQDDNVDVPVDDEPESVDGYKTDNDAQGNASDAKAIDEDKKETEAQGDQQVKKEQSMNTDEKDKTPHEIKMNDLKYPDKKRGSHIPVFKLSSEEIKKLKLWPEAKVPYFIDEFSYDKVLRDKIREYLDVARRALDIDFHELHEPPTDDNERWVFFVNRRGQLDCKDYSTKSFTNNGVQKVIVGYNCLAHGGPIAAIVLALLGVPPIHNSPNRDRYITVYKDHILPDKLGLFKRLKNDEWLFHDLEYDFQSVAHYSPYKYTVDGSVTIGINDSDTFNDQLQSPTLGFGTPLIMTETEHVLLGGEAKHYSYGDMFKVALLYNNIIFNKAKKGLKFEDCKGLYRPRPGLSNTGLNLQKTLPEQPKPEQYITAVQKLYGSGAKELYGETLSSLEDT